MNSQNQEIMKVGLFLYYNACQIPSLFSEVVPDLKIGFYNLAVLTVLLLLNLNIYSNFDIDLGSVFSYEIKLVQRRISIIL